MDQLAFLSEGWIDAARAIHEAGSKDEVPGVELRMNLVVEEVPFPPGTLNAHLDTSCGFVDVELGHLDAPDVTVNLDYQTARAILVDGDAQAGMQAFMAGRVRVEGDMTKLLAFQAAPPSPSQADAAKQIRAMTAT